MKELRDYWHFAQPKVAHKAFNTLKGIIEGIAADMEIHQKEIDELDRWCEEHEYLVTTQPFQDLIVSVRTIISDDIVTRSEPSV